MKPGDWVRIRLADGQSVEGQVWSLAEQDSYVWVALESGEYVKASSGGLVRNERGAKIGRVA